MPTRAPIGRVTVTSAETVAEASVAKTVVAASPATAEPVTVKLPVACPAGIRALAGTVAMFVSFE